MKNLDIIDTRALNNANRHSVPFRFLPESRPKFASNSQTHSALLSLY